ncbi:MAG: type II secretion system protein M [Desulfobia sp.]
MKSYFTNLTRRERMSLIAGSLICASLLVYVLIVEPFQDAVTNYHRQIQIRQDDFTWMQQTAQEIMQLRQTSIQKDNPVSSLSPLAAINASAKKLGLSKALNRMEPEGRDKVRVQMDKVLFDDVIRWLALLKKSYSIEAGEFRAESRDRAGYVDARITLVRKNT